ncbi:unnamed protein product [Symbiodinium natans]|uniref:Transmembrane protein n=1 Tax=Symbiodinium natans TaxID=878477 RepID=A0A812IIM9_9DINO|nr:unnamed protein product [Symbiodinium natans]
MFAGGDKSTRLARSFRSLDVLAFGCLAVAAAIVIGASHAVYQTQRSCREECYEEDVGNVFRYQWFERGDHECERSCGNWELPFRGSQLALALIFLAVASCLCPWVCCPRDESLSGCLACLGCCALIPVALLLMVYLFRSSLSCSSELPVKDISECDYVLFAIRVEVYLTLLAAPTLAACCCLTWARVLMPEKRDGAQPAVRKPAAETDGEPTQIVGQATEIVT